ncbi:hypothetical protein I5677_08070 [Mobilitalea sibirica]|uniref:Uncharacterized protein n=1 Tax=Mobilitalea sibirica TaxID=1462919 RepID=A0A8J7KWS4_9FIRM|nr:hypothetical protein [Mobilitalea sibirica]
MTLGILYLLHNYIFKPIKSLHIYIKAFLDGNTAAMKYQSQKHQDKSDTKMVVLHFKTEAQALEWLQEMGI